MHVLFHEKKTRRRAQLPGVGLCIGKGHPLCRTWYLSVNAAFFRQFRKRTFFSIPAPILKINGKNSLSALSCPIDECIIVIRGRAKVRFRGFREGNTIIRDFWNSYFTTQGLTFRGGGFPPCPPIMMTNDDYSTCESTAVEIILLYLRGTHKVFR